MSLPPALEALLQLILCGCMGNCTTGHCTCKRNGLSCSDSCQCGDSCDNPHNYDLEEESEDDENLTPENRCISNWDKSLSANQDNTPLNDSGRLPVQWLGNGVGNHGNAVNALWALRDFMVKDALNIAKVL
ncbi:Protein polybromo-1 [Nymphon striatum]|nr:Protein polybromo-1 [Nymphon striatum]